MNLSYDFIADNQFYATFSQGFRRGGANAFTLSGPFAEPAELETYKPDTINNYEAGFKGRIFSGRFQYSADLFYDQWNNPQIGTITPYNGWYVVVNGAGAASRGVELELSGSITKELSFSLGYAYANATLTQSFCLPSGDAEGGTVPCGIRGINGEQLPGAPQNPALAI